MNIAGIDIGGANIKAASLDGFELEVPFPFWKKLEKLESQLQNIREQIVQPFRLGVTMTAELADCFADKRHGVEHIIDMVDHVCSDCSPLYYLTNGSMVDSETAKTRFREVAAANWHALAWYVFHQVGQESGFLVDMGSTTTDLIPMLKGIPVIERQTDLDRLANRHMAYLGIGRTPICSVLNEVELDLNNQPVSIEVANELFATVGDAFRWLGEIRCDRHDLETADGKPATREYSAQRIARMVCADHVEIGDSNVSRIAEQVKIELKRRLSLQLESLFSVHPNVPRRIILTGAGDWLVKETAGDLNRKKNISVEIIRFASLSDIKNSQCLPALAVASKRKLYFDRPVGKFDATMINQHSARN